MPLFCAAAALDAGLGHAAAARFGAPPAALRAAAPWNSAAVRLTRELDGAGFHRTLSLRVDAAGAVPAAAAAAAGPAACRLVLLQPLPSGLFADPYQLEDLRRTSPAAPRFELLGPLDLELPAPACQPTLLAVDLGPPQQQHGSAGAAAAAAGWEAEVPLHAKYAQPVSAGLGGWRWALSGSADIVVPAPWLLFHCPGGVGGLEAVASTRPAARGSSGSPAVEASNGEREEGDQLQEATNDQGQQQDLQEQQQEQGPERGHQEQGQQRDWLALQPPSNVPQLLWRVPVGNLDHAAAVAVATTAVSLACAGAIVWAALGSMRAGSKGGKAL
ncbi:hypothetical protein Rsub_03782 [Raphidocelis subcapitata]|uniref:Protein PBN1 n=1 Tax=Raphidocelis subcapitata TaxID=307507 RepID=A0A2V0P156_9CHLO|nr:hypothetical protein Rsub_03782 [Raphidocelis subcapitata]|eukprot:GBF90927.1 hypothetical protein Rsub_03782 [Raphidocelis subcapitata]